MKNLYNIDEFNIFNFCINSSKALNNKLNKFLLFKKVLHTFHDIEEIYEETLEEYASFISYSVIKDALLKNKNILVYEQYVFNVLTGFYKTKFNKSIDSKILAKIWNNIINSFAYITELASNPSYKGIEYFTDIFGNFNHINSTHYNTYVYNVPLIFQTENYIDVVLIVPTLKNNSFNIVIPFLLNSFRSKLNNIYIIDFNLNKISVNFSKIEMTKSLLSMYLKYFNSLYIDFNKINYQNCEFCALSCSRTELLNTRYKETPFNIKTRLIKTRNI